MSKKIVTGIIFAAIIITSVTVISVLPNSNVFAQEEKFSTAVRQAGSTTYKLKSYRHC
jgi:hypothetical protein